MTWLITGGAGYIGAHVAHAFLGAGLMPVVLDDLSTGHEEFVPEGVPLVRASTRDCETVTRVLRDHQVTGVVHLAGFKYAGESVRRPVYTFDQNVDGTAGLLAAMEATGVTQLVFSSSAAVYGTPPTEVVTEATVTQPESPYGRSKLVAEWLIADQAAATALAGAPLRHTSLRYFNVAGSAGDGIYDASPFNVLPRVFVGLAQGQAPVINGNDYATPDGTCVRDYVHVEDVALAHVAAAGRLIQAQPLERVYNLGSGEGTSVLQIMNAVTAITGTPLQPTFGPRRPGDPDRIVADGALAARDLEWRIRHSVGDMVRSAWNAAPRS